MTIDSNPVRQREAYVEQISQLLVAAGISQSELDEKINRQLETDGGVDSLGFDELRKVIAWLETRASAT